MTDTDLELINTMRIAAKRYVATGGTAAALDAEIAEAHRTGFSVTAEYTKLLAAAVREIERKDNV